MSVRIARELRDLRSAPRSSAGLVSDDSVAHTFRRAMRELASSVSIVTVGCGESRTGFTATSVTSLTMTPPSLLVSVQRSSSSMQAMQTGGAFAVNLLATEHRLLADRFAGRAGVSGPARFIGGDWICGGLDVPVLASALAAIECQVARIIEWHTHCVIFGDVAAVRLRDGGEALVYRRGNYDPVPAAVLERPR